MVMVVIAAAHPCLWYWVGPAHSGDWYQAREATEAEFLRLAKVGIFSRWGYVGQPKPEGPPPPEAWHRVSELRVGAPLGSTQQYVQWAQREGFWHP